jgi:molecular chaperone GrpE
MQNEKENLATRPAEAAGPADAPDLKQNVGTVSGDTIISPPAAATPEARAAYEKLEKENAELFERLLRKQAELDNYRKRTQREKEELRLRAAEDLIRALLPVLDGFERALRKRTPGVPETFYQGMELIHRQLFDVLAQAGLTVIETSGQLFDPHYHQAVERVEEAGRRDQEIVEELQRGYKLRDRLVRPAIVKVAVKPKDGGSLAAKDTVKAD